MSLKKRTLEAVGLNARLEESQLIERAKLGEEKAFEQIFRLHKDRVFSICMRMTGSFYEAEDLLQETFVLAFKNIGSFRGDSSFNTWLYRLPTRRLRSRCVGCCVRVGPSGQLIVTGTGWNKFEKEVS